MVLKGIIDEDFVNYKKPSMTLIFPYCTFKCGKNVCQNSPLIEMPNIEVSAESICERYIDNCIPESIVAQGLEPFDSFNELIQLIDMLRSDYNCMDDVVIYTGYTEWECFDKGFTEALMQYKNIVVKFGRYWPNQNPHYDKTLGVELASDNQYARRIC